MPTTIFAKGHYKTVMRTKLRLAPVVCLLLLLAVAASAQSVVVNKYQNSGTTADIVELLVIQNNLDMRGMILKDFSSNMANDNGGKYQFSTDTLWASVPAGTLIVLRNNNSAADTTVGGSDFNLDIGLQNTTYFASLVAGFDIATTDMVMIKTGASGAAGVTGSIHVLAGGTAGAQFTAAPSPKLRATGTSGAGQFIFANNSTQSIADFDGTDATGAATGLTFGSGNNANNTAYINSLRNVGPVIEPTVQASNVTFTNVNATSLTVNWTPGNGSARLVLAKAGAPVDASPSDGTGYAANLAFGSGAQIGTGNFVVHSGPGSSVTVTNLSPSTVYHFAVFEYNGANATADYLITAPAVGSQATAAAFSVSGTVRNRAGVGLAGVSVTLSQGETPLQTVTTDSTGAYTFTNVTAGGDYDVTPSATGFTYSPSSRSVTGLATDQTALDFTALSQVVISEFRFRGLDPDGGGPLTGTANEFVELSNQTDQSVNLSGWALVTPGGTLLHTFAAGVIPARGHYLVGGAGYDLGAYAAPNASLAAGTDLPDGTGIALFNNAANFATGRRLDAVGFAGADAAYVEGGGLTPVGGITADGEYSFVRSLTGGAPRDTDDNEADFVFVSVDFGTYSGRGSILGAPGPENTTSPLVRNASVKASLLDPGCAGTSSVAGNACARYRNTTDTSLAASGTLTIRRVFTNSTGLPVTRLRFRVVDVTTASSAAPPPGVAVLRVFGSSNETGLSTTTGGTTNTQGLTLEEPPFQINGGGINSSLAAGTISVGTPLAPGGSIRVNFLLGVDTPGSFRFFVNVEAITQAPPSQSVHLTMGNPSNATEDVSQPMNFLMLKQGYALAYHRDRGTPVWTSWHLDPSWLGSAPRQNDFRADTTLPPGWYQVQGTDYSGSGYDRGHMTPSADRTSTVALNSETFLMTNMIPQLPANNQGPWADLETYARTLVGQGNELYIVSGGTGTQGTIAAGRVTVPTQTWKVIIVIPQGSDDVNRVTTSTRTIAVIMPNSGAINSDWRTYRVSVDQVEALTGFDFFSNVSPSIQSVIEASVDTLAPLNVGEGRFEHAGEPGMDAPKGDEPKAREQKAKAGARR